MVRGCRYGCAGTVFAAQALCFTGTVFAAPASDAAWVLCFYCAGTRFAAQARVSVAQAPYLLHRHCVSAAQALYLLYTHRSSAAQAVSAQAAFFAAPACAI